MRTTWINPTLLNAFAEQQTDAHRLGTGPEGWVERLGRDVLVSYKSDQARDELLTGLEEWSARAGWQPGRVFGKFLPLQNADRIAPVLLKGEAGAPLTTVVLENGVRYGIDFEAGYSAGLFMDQRQNRQFLRQKAPRRVLNTFAYTCAFSVVGALAGAETVSLDLSRKSLTRGEENFRLNGLDPAPHTFRADDVMEVLPRLIRRQEKFDAIILDPPTFSRNAKGKRFQVEEHLETLIRQALELTTPRAAILLSTNCTRIERTTLEIMARYGLRVARQHGTLHREPDPPDIPASAAARTVWMLVGG